MGAFDDLVAAGTATGASTGAFDDLVAAPTPKRKVGFLESADRMAARTYAQTGVGLALAAAGPAAIASSIAEAITGENPRWADPFFRALVDPSVNAVESWSPGANEEFDPAGSATGMVGAILPQMIATPGGAATAVPIMGVRGAINRAAGKAVSAVGAQASKVVPGFVSRAAPTAIEGATKAQAPMAIPGAVETKRTLDNAGVAPDDSTMAALSDYAFLTAGGALPAAVPGNFFTRALTGAGINVGTGIGQTATRNQILDAYPQQQQDPLSAESLGTDAGVGAIMAALFGPRGGGARVPPAAPPAAPPGPAAGYERWASILQANGVAPDNPRAAQLIAMLDARAQAQAEAQAAQQASMSPEERALQAAQQPPETIVVAPTASDAAKAGRTAEGRMLADLIAGIEKRLKSDRLTVPTRATLEDSLATHRARLAQLEGDPVPDAGAPGVDGTRAGVLSAAGAEARSQRDARNAFDVAGATAENRDATVVGGQRARKQGAADEASMTGQARDLRDASAGGTTTPEGTAATAPESFTFLDVQRDRSGNVTGTGEQVEIVQEGLTLRIGKEDVPAVQVAYEGPNGETITVVVPADRVESLQRPANPRFAQTIEGDTLNTPGPARYRKNSYSPPEGVGTGEQQPDPRNAAQRITTDPGAEFIPARDGTQPAEAPRQGETVDSSGRRVEDPRQLEDRSRGLPDNGERTALLTNEPRKLDAPETIPEDRRLPGPDTPRPDGQMVAGDEGTRPQTYGDSQRQPGDPYIAPRQQTPIVGGERAPGDEAPFIQDRAEATQADRLRETIARLEQRIANIEARPGFKRTAVDKTRLRDLQKQKAGAEEQLRRLIASGAPERPGIIRPGDPPPRQPIQTVEGNRSRKRVASDDAEIRQWAEDVEAWQRKQDAAKAEEQARAQPAQQQQPQGRQRTGSELFRVIRQLGGLQASAALDLVGERAHIANRTRPGLFRNNGVGIDDLALQLRERGWITEEQFNDVDGGAAAVRDLIDREFRGERAVNMRDADAAAEQAARRHWEEAAEREPGVMDNDPVDMVSSLDELDVEASVRNIIDGHLVSRARDIDADAVDALPDSLGPDEFMTEIRRIILESNDPRSQVEGPWENAAGEAPRAAEGGAREQQRGAEPRNEGDGGGILEQPTEAGLRERERAQQAERERVAAAEKAAEDKARADREVNDYKLSGSERPSDASPTQTDMLGNSVPTPKKGGGTQLYSGMPLDKMVEAIAKAYGYFAENSRVAAWLAKEAAAIGKNAKGLLEDIKSLRDRPKSSTGHPALRLARWALDSASGAMRAKVAQFNSPTATWVMDQFHTEAGSSRVTGTVYHLAVQAHVNKTLTRLSDALGPIMDDKSMMAQVVAQVRNPKSIRRGTKIGDAAAAVSKILAEQLQYLRDAGVDVGEVKDGYYPREFDEAMAAKNPAEFTAALQRAYEENGVPAKEAKAAAEELAHHVIYDGGIDSVVKPERGNVRSPFLKNRVFGKDVDKPSHPLNKFLVADPASTLSAYVTRVARRAEVARRFGDSFEFWGDLSSDRRKELIKEKGEKWVKENTGITRRMIDEGAGDLIADMRDYIALGAGLKRPDLGKRGVIASSWIRTWTTLALLEKATLSSLTEIVVPSIRSGNVADVVRSLHGTVRDLARAVGAGTVKAEVLRDLAEDIGIVSGNMHDNINAARFSGGDPATAIQSKILDRFFKRTGLTAWTDATRMGALDVSRVFMRRSALRAQQGGKLGARNLMEVGIPEKDVQGFSQWLAGLNDGMPTAADLGSKAGQKYAAMYRAALLRFNAQSIQVVDKTLKPQWMAGHWGATIGQLQSFNYAFWENVWKRQGRMLKDAATGKGYTPQERASMTVAPMISMTIMFGIGLAVGEARDKLLGDPKRRQEETTKDKLLKAASRSLPVAPLDPLLNWVTAARYQRGTTDFLAGPALSTIARGADSFSGLALHNSESTNTAERAMAKVVWDLGIEPATNAILALTTAGVLGTAGSAALTQVAGAGDVREKFVSSVAGPDQRKPRKKPGEGPKMF
jgi:hypothetical protein